MSDDEMDSIPSRSPSLGAPEPETTTNYANESSDGRESPRLLVSPLVCFTPDDMERELNKLSAGEEIPRLVQADLTEFKKLFGQYLNGDSKVNWSDIRKPSVGSALFYETLTNPTPGSEKALLDQLIIVKYNSEIGTSMGFVGPKSEIPLRSNKCALDMIVDQVRFLKQTYHSDVPVILMNSSKTHEETCNFVRKYDESGVKIFTFRQSTYPRIYEETNMPIPKDLDVNKDSNAWYSPGHGDFFKSFTSSGLMNYFIEQGRKYVFFSDIMNIGASVDLDILKRVVEDQEEMVAEVIEKNRSVIKEGGALVHCQNRLRLLQAKQIPKVRINTFQSVVDYRLFSTNNFWIGLSAIQRIVEGGRLKTDVVVNSINNLEDGVRVIQLESSMGSGLQCFEKTLAIRVPESRFWPMNSASDLLLIRSNLNMLEHGKIISASRRIFMTSPLIKLDDEYFQHDFTDRFISVPDILQLEFLHVSGDVVFGKDVSLSGKVVIIANKGEKIRIPPGAVLDNVTIWKSENIVQL